MLKHGRQPNKDQMQAQAAEYWRQRRQLEEAAVSLWSKTRIAGDTTTAKKLQALYESNPRKARFVAAALSNQDKALKLMSETTMAQAFGPTLRPENFLNAVYIGNANSKRGDIFTEIALQSVDDAIIYINMKRADSLRGSTAGDYMYSTTNQYYEGETYTGAVGTSDGATTSYTSSAMAILPLIPYSIRVLVDGAQVGVDTGSGVISGATLDTGSVVDYTTGIITVVFKSGYVPDSGAAITVIYNWNSESASNFASYVGKMDIELTKLRFSALPYPLGYSISAMTQLMFDRNGIGDAMQMLEQAIGDEHARAKDFRAIARARQLALGNAQLTFDTNFGNVGELSAKSRAQIITNTIGKATAALQNDLQRGAINKIVAGQDAVNYFTLHDQWVPDNTDGRYGVYKAGTLNGMEVFACPADTGLVATNEALLTFKNEDQPMDTALIFGNVTDIDASLTYPNFVTDSYSAVVEDSKAINGKFVRLLTLQNLV